MVSGNGGCEKSYAINIAWNSFKLISKVTSLMSQRYLALSIFYPYVCLLIETGL